MRTPCRVWTGGKNSGGYGHIRVYGRKTYTHRAMFEYFNGPIPQGMCVLHRCDVRACCEISHLFLGTNAENMADRGAKARSAIGEQNGSAKLTDVQAVEIFHAYQRGDKSRADLATKYDIGLTTVDSIVNRTERFAWIAVNHKGTQ